MRSVSGKRRRTACRLLLGVSLVLYISTLTKDVRSDGGSVLCQKTSDSILVTAFSTDDPVRIGRSDISFLLERAADAQPILDAEVLVELENEAGITLHAEATRRRARNKLLYCSLIDFPKAGHWTMKIIVKHGAERSEIFHHLLVTEAPPTILAYWKLLAFPPVVLLLFITNQWLRMCSRVPRYLR